MGILGNRAVSTVEFLLSYGWAFLIVMVLFVTIWQIGVLDLSGQAAFSYVGFPHVIKPISATGSMGPNTARSTMIFVNAGSTPLYVINANIFNLNAGGFFNPDNSYCSIWIKLVSEEDWVQLSGPEGECPPGWDPPPWGALLSPFASTIAQSTLNEHAVPRWELLASSSEGVKMGANPICKCQEHWDMHGELCGYCASGWGFYCVPCCHPPCDMACGSKHLYFGPALKVGRGEAFALYVADSCGRMMEHPKENTLMELAVHLSYINYMGSGGDFIERTASGVVRGTYEWI